MLKLAVTVVLTLNALVSASYFYLIGGVLVLQQR